MPCCAASTAIEVSVFSLSPFTPAELVKPAATLPCQPCSAHTGALASANAWKTADGLPMYVGAPKTMASARARAAQSPSWRVPTSCSAARAPGTLSAPAATARAWRAVWP
jgi:hypothetical protein